MSDVVQVILIPVISTIVTAVISYVGLKLKNILEKYFTDKEIKDAAETCVRAVEQLKKDLHGEEKYNYCVEQFGLMLAEKGISITEIEIRMLIESAVNRMNSNKLHKEDAN